MGGPISILDLVQTICDESPPSELIFLFLTFVANLTSWPEKTPFTKSNFQLILKYSEKAIFGEFKTRELYIALLSNLSLLLHYSTLPNIAPLLVIKNEQEPKLLREAMCVLATLLLINKEIRQICLYLGGIPIIEVYMGRNECNIGRYASELVKLLSNTHISTNNSKTISLKSDPIESCLQKLQIRPCKFH